MRLLSLATSVAQVPASITIPAGEQTATFTITSSAAADPTIVQIWAFTPDNALRTYNLSVNPAQPAGPTLSSVSFVPTSIIGGQNSTGTVRFTAPMVDGAVVQLFSSNPSIARVPQETVVSANPNAILSVYSRSGSLLFDLTNRGGGRYTDERGWVTNPVQISVRSNFGGSASAKLQS